MCIRDRVRALPVNQAAFEYVIDHTSKRVYDINDDGAYEKSEEEYSDEIKTNFFNEYLDIINSISSCTLYLSLIHILITINPTAKLLYLQFLSDS